MDDNERGLSVVAYSFIIIFQPQFSTSVNQPKTLVVIGVYSEDVSKKKLLWKEQTNNLREIQVSRVRARSQT